MSKSLLLHSLSLKDRILEPNRLPLSGQVWAYNKQKHSKEEFVGNCLTMLSLLGMHDADIHWKEDILAFDARWENRTFTVIISLQDDSLASEYYYFLGIWECPEEPHKGRHRFADSRPWNDEDLIKPDIFYSITVSSEPLQLPEVIKQFGGEPFGQSIYGGEYYLCGTTYPDESHAGKFALFPATRQNNRASHDIRHALYSLRNLMALMGKAVEIHDETLTENAYEELKAGQQQLSLKAITPELAASEYEQLSHSYGETLLTICDLLDTFDNHAKQVSSLDMLFGSIVSELKVESSNAFRPLFHRMKLPFKHAEALLVERRDGTARIEKKIQILQQTLISQMLAKQQQAIEALNCNQ